jgi:hypothetical protein
MSRPLVMGNSSNRKSRNNPLEQHIEDDLYIYSRPVMKLYNFAVSTSDVARASTSTRHT